MVAKYITNILPAMIQAVVLLPRRCPDCPAVVKLCVSDPAQDGRVQESGYLAPGSQLVLRQHPGSQQDRLAVLGSQEWAGGGPSQ